MTLRTSPARWTLSTKTLAYGAGLPRSERCFGSHSSEAQFKTLKYRPEFPEHFGSLEDARAFCQRFFRWYNHQHHHSVIVYHTPADIHDGRAEQVRQVRAQVLQAAYVAHPERFVPQAPIPPPLLRPRW